MDIPNKQQLIKRKLAGIVVKFTAALLLAPITGLAQVPYNVDGVVPDANCCFEFQDPVGSVSEFGPVN